MTVPVSEIGLVYDLLLATRDGSTLPCRNKDGKIVNVSQIAYVTSIDRQGQGQHEESELQHKDRITQLASPNLIDREFDQWPQVSQGDWSGGSLQRVFTGATPISGGTESDPTRYWDGLGLLWPITDYLPVRPIRATPDQNEGGALMKTVGVGTVGGFVGNFSPQASVFVYMYQQVNAPQNNILIIQGDGSKITVTNPGGIAAGTLPAVDYVIAFGMIFYLFQAPGNLILTVINGAGIGTNVVTIASATLLPVHNVGMLAAGAVGDREYVAFGWAPAAGSAVANIRLIDVTAGSFTLAAIDVPLASGAAVALPQYQQMIFVGDTLVVSAFTYNEMVIMQYNIASATWSTLARFPNTNALYMCEVAGSIFVLATSDTAAVNEPNSVDMNLITGGNVQNIGPLQIQGVGGLSSFITGEGFPTAYGPYAIFPIYYFDGVSTHAVAFAYDVLRGRLFKLDDIGGFAQFLGNFHGPRLGVFSSLGHPFAGGTLAAQWGVALPVLSEFGVAQDTTNVQRLLFGVSNGGFQPFQRPGTQITSSLIDFTSAQLKLFRQLVVSWAQPGLPNEADITVAVNVWLDQDPASLNAVPDFTATVAGGSSTQGQTQLKLTINKIAHKLVYRVTTTSGVSGTNLTSAVKLVSVVVRAATGWVQSLKLDLAPNVVTNAKNGLVWERQSSPGTTIDAVVAYNFLRQLWRLQGGECIATFPNGDSGNWLIQDLAFDSPKPFAASMRADQQTQYQSLASLKIREDV
jgi:hypothetical protein